MSSGPTLHSRLRVLVAKAFRAEKLYSSVNNSKSDRLTNIAVLSEAASEIRAKEWQRSHYQLRTAINEILTLGSNALIAEQVAELRDRFLAKAKESATAVERGADELVETARRHEFAHIFKISLELIRLKAQAQACKVVADELASILDVSGRQVLPKSIEGENTLADEQALNALSAVEAESRSNVIPLKKRFAFGSKKG